MQQNEAEQAPHGFVEEAGVYRLCRNQRAVGIIALDPGLDLAARHAEDAVRVAAERLMVHEVAPASDTLADQEAERYDVVHREQPHLAQLADHRADNQGADDTAVDREAAVPDVEDRFPVAGIALPVEDDVVQSCADDTADDAADDAVQCAVGVQTEAAHSAECIEHGEHHADRDQHAVPCDGKAEQGKGGAPDGQLKPELREADAVRIRGADCRVNHNSDSSFPSDSGSMTERQILSVQKRVSRQPRTSSAVS